MVFFVKEEVTNKYHTKKMQYYDHSFVKKFTQLWQPSKQTHSFLVSVHYIKINSTLIPNSGLIEMSTI